jgi:hypothetical protein
MSTGAAASALPTNPDRPTWRACTQIGHTRNRPPALAYRSTRSASGGADGKGGTRPAHIYDNPRAAHPQHAAGGEMPSECGAPPMRPGIQLAHSKRHGPSALTGAGPCTRSPRGLPQLRDSLRYRPIASPCRTPFAAAGGRLPGKRPGRPGGCSSRAWLIRANHRRAAGRNLARSSYGTHQAQPA